jgi:rhodanese-related sulfurtransferase
MTKKSFLKDGVPTLSIGDVSDVSGFLLVDVRRTEEFNAELGHIKGAVLKTLGPDLENYLETLDRQTNILFICRSGVRSASATLQAINNGFTNVFNMEGGMLGWNQKGFYTAQN